MTRAANDAERRHRDGVRLHVDHIVPVSKGGKTEMHNLQTLCEACKGLPPVRLTPDL